MKPIVLGRASAQDETVQLDLSTLITTRMLVQGNSGAGKSWLLRLLAEQAAPQCQLIVLDPEGEFATLREKLDMLLVGRDGELETDCKTAAALAHKLIDLRVSAVIDLYDLPLDKRRTYVKLFLNSVVAVPRSKWHPTLFVIDEAHSFCPERGAGEAESTAAVINLMAWGRKRSFAGLLATQRLSKLHKDAAAECNNLFIGRTWLDNDQKRVGDLLGLPSAARHQLRELKPGDWLAFGPALNTNGITQFKADQVRTTHPTSLRRHKIIAPAPSKSIQRIVPELQELAKASPEQVHDLEQAQRRIDELRRTIARLEREVSERPAETKTVVQHAVKSTQLTKVEQLVTRLKTTTEKLQVSTSELTKALSSAAQSTTKSLPSPLTRPVAAARPVAPTKVASVSSPTNSETSTELPRGEVLVLTALLQHPDGVTREQLSALTGYKRATRDAYVYRLITRGYAQADGTRIRCTPAGSNALPSIEPLPTGKALQDWWLQRLPAGEAATLQQVISRHPDGCSREEIGEALGYKRATRDAYIYRLIVRKLIMKSGGLLHLASALIDG